MSWCFVEDSDLEIEYTYILTHCATGARYYLLEELGSGFTSRVFKCLNEKGEEEAIKIFKDQTEKYFDSEVKVMRHLNKDRKQKNCIKMSNYGKGVMKNCRHRLDSEEVLFIVTEYAQNGELFDLIYYMKKGFGEDFSKIIFQQIIDGMDYCHKMGVAHHDLKTENILVTKDLKVKIADFGFSEINETGTSMIKSGTSVYSPPEVANSPYGYCPFNADIFSLGVILYIIVAGSFPFSSTNIEDHLFKYIVEDDFSNFWKKIKHSFSEEFKDLFQKLISYNPVNRASMKEILDHPWLKKEAFLLSKREYKKELTNRIKFTMYIKNKNKEEDDLFNCSQQ